MTIFVDIIPLPPSFDYDILAKKRKNYRKALTENRVLEKIQKKNRKDVLINETWYCRFTERWKKYTV